MSLAKANGMERHKIKQRVETGHVQYYSVASHLSLTQKAPRAIQHDIIAI